MNSTRIVVIVPGKPAEHRALIETVKHVLAERYGEAWFIDVNPEVRRTIPK